jgi:hypothetical protein
LILLCCATRPSIGELGPDRVHRGTRVVPLSPQKEGQLRSLARHIGFDGEVAVARRKWWELGRAGEYGHGSPLLSIAASAPVRRRFESPETCGLRDRRRNVVQLGTSPYFGDNGKLKTGNWKLGTGNWKLGTGNFYLKSTTAYVPIFGSENSIAPLATT